MKPEFEIHINIEGAYSSQQIVGVYSTRLKAWWKIKEWTRGEGYDGKNCRGRLEDYSIESWEVDL